MLWYKQEWISWYWPQSALWRKSLPPGGGPYWRYGGRAGVLIGRGFEGAKPPTTQNMSSFTQLIEVLVFVQMQTTKQRKTWTWLHILLVKANWKWLDRCKNINKKKETKDVKVEGNATRLISIYKWECRWILSKQEHKLSEQAYVWMRMKVSTNKHRILPTPYIPLHAAQEKPRVIGLTNSRDVQNAKMFKIN